MNCAISKSFGDVHLNSYGAVEGVFFKQTDDGKYFVKKSR